jgi:regulator of replication initiation timing
MKAILKRLIALNEKVDSLIDSRQKLTAENENLKVELNRLMSLIEDQKNQIVELEEQNKLIKLAKNLEGDSVDSEVKVQIDHYIKEINKCIELIKR